MRDSSRGGIGHSHLGATITQLRQCHGIQLLFDGEPDLRYTLHGCPVRQHKQKLWLQACLLLLGCQSSALQYSLDPVQASLEASPVLES